MNDGSIAVRYSDLASNAIDGPNRIPETIEQILLQCQIDLQVSQKEFQSS